MNAEIGKLACLKRTHILLTTNSLLLQRLRLGPFQFQMCLMRKKSHIAILCALNFKYPNLPMSQVQLTKSTARLCSFINIRNPLALLINLKQLIIKKWLLDSLQRFKISQVCYNDITKKTCSIPDARSKPLHFFSA